MKKLLSPKHLWRGILIISIAAFAVMLSVLWKYEDISSLLTNRGEPAAEAAKVIAQSGETVSITADDGNDGARINTTENYTITAGLDSSKQYRLVLVVGNSAPGNAVKYIDVPAGSSTYTWRTNYTYTDSSHSYYTAAVIQSANQEVTRSPLTVATCGCSSYSGCGTSCDFRGFDSCKDEAQASGKPMIQVCRPSGPQCEDAVPWQPICHEDLAPAGTCERWSCNNEQCTPGQPSEQKNIIVITKCIPGTGDNGALAGNVEVSLVNLSPDNLHTPANSNPASASSAVSIVAPNQVYAVRALPEDNQDRDFTPVSNGLGCQLSGNGFEWCPWSSLPTSGGTFVFQIDCSVTPPPPPPPPPPPVKANPSCDSFTVKNTRTGENCTGSTCYAEPGDQLVLSATGTAGDWASSPNVVRFAYMSSQWQPIGGNLERGDWPYGSAVNWNAPSTNGSYMVAAATGWVGPLGDGNPFNDDGRLCTGIAPDYYVWQPSGNNYVNLIGQTCSFDSCTKTLIVQQQPNQNPEVQILKTLVSTRTVKVGDSVTFRLQATNTGNTVLTTIPVTDEFETEYLDYATATLAPSRVDEHGDTGLGTIEWTNILGPSEVLFPGQVKAWDVTFTAMKPTTNIGDGDADNCMWIYDGTVRDDQGNVIPPEDLVSCDWVSIIHTPTPVVPAVDIQKMLTSAGDIYVGDEVKFDLVITNTGPIDLVEYALIDTYDASYLRYVRATGDKKESTGEYSLTNVTIPFSVGGGHLVANDLQNLFGVLNPNDQIYVHLVFEATRAGTTTDTARINAKGDNGEWVSDEDNASVVIISVKPPKTGASEVIGLGVFTLLGSGGIAKLSMILKKKSLVNLFK